MSDVQRHPERSFPWRLWPMLAWVAVWAQPQAARAAVLDACQPGDSELVCHLRSVLTLLQSAAVILAVLLLAAILAAVRAYRRKPRKIAPEDISPDGQ